MAIYYITATAHTCVTAGRILHLFNMHTVIHKLKSDYQLFITRKFKVPYSQVIKDKIKAHKGTT